MVIAILLILLVISVAIVGALYSSFLAFYATFGDTLEYNKAYYVATAGLERAELVLKYRMPGYEGSGGWERDATSNKDITYGNAVDSRPSAFSYFSTGTENGKADNGMVRDILSRTTQIPRAEQGNVDWMLVTGDSLNYNMLDYVNAENFIFNLDPLDGHPYQSPTDLTSRTVSSISGALRLPPLLRYGYGFRLLDDTASSDIGKDGVYDDAVVDRGFRGNYIEGSSSQTMTWNPFQILPTSSVDYINGKRVVYPKDSLLRESGINGTSPNTTNRLVWGNSYSPFPTSTSTLTGLTVLSASEAVLSGLTFGGGTNSILGTGRIANLLFRISLLNLLYSQSKNIYPYLEYQLSFYDSSNKLTEVADRFYTITSVGKYGNYEVKLLVKKPTIKESILGSFTVIF